MSNKFTLTSAGEVILLKIEEISYIIHFVRHFVLWEVRSEFDRQLIGKMSDGSMS